MKYTVYRITNLINGKTYIGMHQTLNANDSYMGSGKLIKAAIKKYGLENFKKEILHTFDNEDDMRSKEKELVVLGENSYNLCDGGKGGFGYINRTGKAVPHITKENSKILSEKARSRRKFLADTNSEWHSKYRQKMSLANKGKQSFLGKSHTEETKTKMSLAASKRTGEANGSFGTIWITNDLENKKIKSTDLDNWIEKGYRRGRKVYGITLVIPYT